MARGVDAEVDYDGYVTGYLARRHYQYHVRKDSIALP
jgi:hypothetical protein